MDTVSNIGNCFILFHTVPTVDTVGEVSPKVGIKESVGVQG